MHGLQWAVPMLACALLLGVAPVLGVAGEVIAGVKARGLLRCGVSEGIPGFSQQDANGRWQGMDADFCRAVAAAVLGDGERVKLIPLKSSTRFPALQAKQIDLLARNTTWNLTREAVLRVQFPAILYYDSQAFMVPVSAGIDPPSRSEQRDRPRRCASSAVSTASGPRAGSSSPRRSTDARVQS